MRGRSCPEGKSPPAPAQRHAAQYEAGGTNNETDPSNRIDARPDPSRSRKGTTAETPIEIKAEAPPGFIVLDAAVRSYEPIAPVVLSWQFPVWMPDHDADPAALARPKGRGEHSQDRKDREGRESILQVLKRHGRQSRRKLRGLAGMGSERLGRLILQLEADSEIEIQTNAETETEYISLPGWFDETDHQTRPADHPSTGWTDGLLRDRPDQQSGTVTSRPGEIAKAGQTTGG